MKVSLSWLNELVELPTSVEALCDLLTKAGVEVEGVESRGVAIDKVVVGQILESTQHPNADRLSVCRVDDGSGEPRQIVCGAKNYKVGDKVPVALPGAVLPGDFKIKVGKLRGVQSEGMMCSGKELGIAEDAAGLLILSPDLTAGTALSEVFPAETVLDLEVTPNRPDLLSHYGMAREIATLLDRPLRLPKGAEVLVGAAVSKVTSPEVQIVATEACPYYTARKIRGVKVGPSPAWLKERLELIGLRSINNVVDVTNYVMLELGQPLHAFDLAKVEGGIRVRFAAQGEELTVLNGEKVVLAADHLLIADTQKGLAVAGVMGGAESGVDESTTDLLLESAYFVPSGIRRTSRELGLSSDSSYRFERGVDAGAVEWAAARSVQLILEVAGGSVESDLVVAGEEPISSRVVSFRIERLRSVLGAEVSEAQVDQILTGFGLVKQGDGWLAPSFRQDLLREIDLIEEVARVIGIEAIPARERTRYFASSEADRRHDQAMRLRERLAALGYHEARSLTLISDAALALFPVSEVLRVRNPLNEEQVILRPSLLPGLLEAVARNVRGGNRDLRLFELGRVFRSEGREERASLGLLLTGGTQPGSWRDAKPRGADFFDLKGTLERLGLGGLSFEATSHPALAMALEIRMGGKVAGVAGQLFPAQARALDVATPVLVAEIDLEGLSPDRLAPKFVGLPKFPSVSRDVALVAPLEVLHSQVDALLRSAGEELLVGVELFDVFSDPKGGKIPADRKSLAYALTYRSNERTLTAEEVSAAHQRLKERLRAELGVSFRE